MTLIQRLDADAIAHELLAGASQRPGNMPKRDRQSMPHPGTRRMTQCRSGRSSIDGPDATVAEIRVVVDLAAENPRVPSSLDRLTRLPIDRRSTAAGAPVRCGCPRARRLRHRGRDGHRARGPRHASVTMRAVGKASVPLMPHRLTCAIQPHLSSCLPRVAHHPSPDLPIREKGTRGRPVVSRGTARPLAGRGRPQSAWRLAAPAERESLGNESTPSA